MRAASTLTRPQHAMEIHLNYLGLHRLGGGPLPRCVVRAVKQHQRSPSAAGRTPPTPSPSPSPSPAATASPVHPKQQQQSGPDLAVPAAKRQRLHLQQQHEEAVTSPFSAAAAAAAAFKNNVVLLPPSQQQHQQQQDGNSQQHSRAAAALDSQRTAQLAMLQSFLGYEFRRPHLLDQACTHDSSGLTPSYRELAFIGDAALWLMFAEHAYRSYASSEDAVSGAWPALLSKLLSRANCAATARQWGLDAYLQHSTPHSSLTRPAAAAAATQNHLLAPPHTSTNSIDTWQQQQQQQQQDLAGTDLRMSQAADSWVVDSSGSSSSTATNRSSSVSSSSGSSSSSCSSPRTSGKYAGVWTSDTLAEMFEGVVGALLLDCGGDFEALKQLLLPWVDSSLEAAKQQVTTTAAPPAATPAPAALEVCNMDRDQQQQQQQQQQQEALQHLQAALTQQLQVHCGFSFSSQQHLSAACSLMLQLMQAGVCCAQAETQRFLGFGMVQFAAAMQAYRLQHSRGEGMAASSSSSSSSSSGPLPNMPVQLLSAGGVDWLQRTSSSSSSSSDNSSMSSISSVSDSSSSSSSMNSQMVVAAAAAAAAAAAGARIGSGRRDKVVHQMAKHGAELTTVRHRAKMWLMLLEGASSSSMPWCPGADSYLVSSNWKKQKQALSRCLDLLLAAVYADAGLEAAVGVASMLIVSTPPTTHDKSWMPDWARHNTNNYSSSSSK